MREPAFGTGVVCRHVGTCAGLQGYAWVHGCQHACVCAVHEMGTCLREHMCTHWSVAPLASQRGLTGLHFPKAQRPVPEPARECWLAGGEWYC